MITGPIREGDQFADRDGHIWKVIRVIPFGKLDLFDHARSLFNMEYTKDFRASGYTRFPADTAISTERNAA